MLYRLASLLILVTLLCGGRAAAAAIPVLTIDGPIGPATAQYVGNGLREAQNSDAPAVIIKMNTPGGLDAAMRTIIRAILSSSVPVISWVAPSGARAASAGTYIAYASHVAAMAPGTNLGAATPVQIGGMPGGASPESGGGGDKGSDGDASDDAADRDQQAGEGSSTMERKMVNDAVAYIRSLAKLRGRNAEWAERAVRESASLPATEAVSKDVVDFMAADLDELLSQADGRRVQLDQGQVSMAVQGATTRPIEPSWRNELLTVITNPNVAYILMLVGVYGLIFELASPGAVIPGVVGTIALLLALLAFQAMPINYAGLGLLILGVAFMLGEAVVPSFGALGIGGVVAFALGSTLLFDSDAQGFQVSMGLVAGVTLASLLASLGIATLAVRAYRRPHVTGRQELPGMRAMVVQPVTPEGGRVRVHGELWWAVSEQPIPSGEYVQVVSSDGLTLRVMPHPSE